MSFSDQLHFLDPKTILIKRDERQRKIFTTDDLKEDIPKRGLMNPIIVRPLPEGSEFSYELIAGERRLTTFLEMPQWGHIPARFTSEIDPIELKLIELSENVKRQDLSWPELCEAVAEIHELNSAKDDTWTLEKTSIATGYQPTTVYKLNEVGKELKAGNERLLDSSGWNAAYSLLETQRERKKEAASAKLASAIADDFKSTESYAPADVKAIQSEAKEIVSPSEAPVPIMQGDALKWMKDYRGVPFNFGHCDFPYGIDLQDSDQAHSESQGTYEDSPEVYWELLGTMLNNIDRIFSPSAHIMFWFSPKLYVETLEFFEANAPDLWVQDIPLVWHKTDNTGILADPRRRPRNITEFAFLISRGDRKLVENKSVANCYGAPSSKVIHQSEKPIPVLRHFFRMLVDETTRMIDPTSGSANSLVAALDFNPETMLGIEKDVDFFTRSTAAFKKARALKIATGG